MKDRIKNLLLSNQTTGQTVLKNTFWLSISQLVHRVIKIGIVIYAARALGVEGYGVFSYALAAAGFMTMFSNVGIESILIKESAQRPDLRSKYLSTTFFIKLVLLALLFVLIVGAIPYMTNVEGAIPLLPIVAILLILDGLRGFGFSFFRSLERMETEAAINSFTGVAIVIVAAIVLTYAPTPYNLALAYVIGSAFGLLATIYAMRDHLKDLLTHFARDLVRPILLATWPLAVMGMMGSVMLYTDILMLGWMRDAADLGLYTAAQKPIQFLILIPTLIGASVLPAMSRLTAQSGENLKTFLQQSLTMVMLVALPIAASGIVLSQEIIVLAYGSDYLGATTVFNIFLLSLLIMFPAIILGQAIIARGEQQEFLKYILGGAFINVVLNLYFVSRWGIVGAVSATLIAQLLTHGSIYYVLKSRLSFSVISRLSKILLATVITAGALLLLQTWGAHVVLSGIVAIVIYPVILIITKEPTIYKLKSLMGLTGTNQSS